MPRKARTPESLALNRENQRRSRARQRELLDDLQSRVREYERRDAQATFEMQRVARVVAGENAALRGLLAAKGVAAEEVEAHLEAVRHEDKASMKVGVSSFTPVSTPSSAPSPVVIPSRTMSFPQSQCQPIQSQCQPIQSQCQPIQSQCQPIQSQCQPIQSQCQPTQSHYQPQGCGPVRENSHPPINFQPVVYSPPTPSTTSKCSTIEESGCCSKPQPPPITIVKSCTDKSSCCPGPQPSPQPQPQHPRSPDKIHCMEAATILAQIRGHSDISMARASLGCASNDNCMVRNTDLLNMMDEMT